MEVRKSVFWVVVADAARARIIETERNLGSPVLVCELTHAASQVPVTELVSGPRGRMRSGPDGVGTAFDRHSDPHRVEAEKFARQIACELERGHQEHRYDGVVLCAPPQFLGALRAELATTVERLVVGSASHDWTALPLRELPDRIRKALPADATLVAKVH